MNSSSAEENINPNKTMAILAHIGGFFTSWIAPLVIYLISKSNPNELFSTKHAREALNFQLTLFVAYIICFILSFVLIGLFLFWLVMLSNLVLSIIAAVKASNGVDYKYPMTIRLIK